MERTRFTLSTSPARTSNRGFKVGDGDWVWGPEGGGYPVYKSAKRITDHSGPRGTWKPVSSTRIETDIFQLGQTTVDLFPFDFRVDTRIGDWNAPLLDTAVSLANRTQVNHDLQADIASMLIEYALADELATKTRQGIINQFPVVVSIPNFLYELRDFANLREKVNDIVKLFSQYDVNAVGKFGAGTFLEWKFAWAPLIADLQKITKIVDILVARMRHLKKTNGIRHRESFAVRSGLPVPSPGDPPISNEDMFYATTERPPSFLLPGSYDGTPLVVTVPHQPRERVLQHVELTRTIDFRGDDVWLTATLATLQGFGFLNPLGIVWNMIPFSFIVDWIVPFGDWLDNYQFQPYEATLQVHSATASYSAIQLFSHWNLKRLDLLGFAEWERVGLSSVHEYHRRAGYVDGPTPVEGLSPDELALAIALGVANAPLKRVQRRRPGRYPRLP